MSLLALPSELLQHIAHFLPYSSLLQLIWVNRQVYSACYDPLVFKNIVQDCFCNTDGAIDRLIDLYKQPGRVELDREQLCWPEGELLLERSSFQDTKRLARGIEELIKLSTLEPAAWLTTGTTNMAEWLPPLLALHHPASWCLEPDMFLLPHGQLSQPNTSSTSSLLMNRWLSRTTGQARDRLALARLQAVHFSNFSFMLNYTTLQRLKSTDTSKEVLALFIRHFFPNWITAQPSLDPLALEDSVLQQLSGRVPGHGTFVRDCTLTQASAMLLALLVAIAITYDHREQRLLPAPSRIPFSELMDISSIYHHSAESFSTCHYKRMTKPEFLSGRWMGYYSNHQIRARTFQIDSPMQNIRMVVCEPTEEARTRLRISAVVERETRGHDILGEFLLSGRVREDGLVSIVKQYLISGKSWMWTGRITPFGIVGVWGRHSFGGYFWIFKEEWM